MHRGGIQAGKRNSGDPALYNADQREMVKFLSPYRSGREPGSIREWGSTGQRTELLRREVSRKEKRILYFSGGRR